MDHPLFRFIPLLLIASLGVACGPPPAPPEDPPTFHQDIAPILAEHCSGCHNPDGMQPGVLFDTGEAAQTLAPLITGNIETGAMPPFFAEETPECPNPWGWLHDPRLSEDEKDLVADWAAAGAPIGEPEVAADVQELISVDLEDPDLIVLPRGKYTTPPISDIEDQFICFSLDPQLTEQEWLESFQILPDDLEVVHHVLVGIDPTGASGALVDENDVYPCFGAFGVAAAFIGAWVPNASPTVYPIQSAVRVPAGARVLLQMHYHLTSEEHEDGTGIAIRWAEGTPVREAQVGLAGNAGSQQPDGTGLQPGPNDAGDPSFFIPANVNEHTETMLFNFWPGLVRQQQIFLVANHMHYIGTNMRMWLERGSTAPDSENACLLHTPRWDFDWQQFYFYDASSGNAPMLWPGDKLWLQCEYDNTLDNPGVVRALLEGGLEEPVDIALGEGSLSEMCIGLYGTVFDIPMTVEDATHSADLGLQIASEGFGFDTACTGPGGLKLGDDGSLSAVGACGLDVLGLLSTIELSFEGSVTGQDSAGGQVHIGILGLQESIDTTWTGTVDGDTLTLTVDASGIFAGNEVSFAGSFTATLLP